jgi:hypothetical protein
MAGLAALLFPSVSAEAAAAGGAMVKLLFLARTVVLIALATGFLHLRKQRWADVGLGRPDWRRFALAIAAGLVMWATSMAVIRSGLPHQDVRPVGNPLVGSIKGDPLLYLYFLLPVTWGSMAVGEELIFRGFIHCALEQAFGGRRLATLAALVGQAALFGLLHSYLGAVGTLIAAMAGLALGLVWLIAGRNLWAGIAIHLLFASGVLNALQFGATPR